MNIFYQNQYVFNKILKNNKIIRIIYFIYSKNNFTNRYHFINNLMKHYEKTNIFRSTHIQLLMKNIFKNKDKNIKIVLLKGLSKRNFSFSHINLKYNKIVESRSSFSNDFRKFIDSEYMYYPRIYFNQNLDMKYLSDYLKTFIKKPKIGSINFFISVFTFLNYEYEIYIKYSYICKINQLTFLNQALLFTPSLNIISLIRKTEVDLIVLI